MDVGHILHSGVTTGPADPAMQGKGGPRPIWDQNYGIMALIFSPKILTGTLKVSGSKASHKTHIVYMNFIYKHFNKRKQNVHSSS